MKVLSNLATSLDGKIGVASREHFLLGTAADMREMLRLRGQVDGVLVGAGTFRAYKQFSGRARGAPPGFWNVIVSTRLDGISPEWPFFKETRVRRLLCASSSTPPERLEEFRATSEIFLFDPASPISVPRQILDELKRRKFRSVIVEGGGGTLWDFARENLIDEYHVTLTPRILGGTEAPTLVDGPGFHPKDSLNLKLTQAKRVGNELYLVYRKTTKRGTGSRR